MPESEMIRLDAWVEGVIAETVFRARLANGHRFVAYLARQDKDCGAVFRTGDRVTVDLSPFDMSKGCIVVEDRRESLQK